MASASCCGFKVEALANVENWCDDLRAWIALASGGG